MPRCRFLCLDIYNNKYILALKLGVKARRIAAVVKVVICMH
jgi:DNA-directed RNA polymerase subunit K/omega